MEENTATQNYSPPLNIETLPLEPPPEKPFVQANTFETSSQQSPPSPPPNPSQEQAFSPLKFIIIAVSMIIVVVLAGVGLLSVRNRQNPPSNNQILTAHCLTVKAYDQNWLPLSSSQLSELKSGDKIKLTVSGETGSDSFDKARFQINGIASGEITRKKPNSEEFYIEYIIPEQISKFQVEGEIHHTSLGWLH